MSYHLTLDSLFSSKIENLEGKEYNFIVIGAGAYGTSFVHHVLQNKPNSKILVLEKGNFLLPEHFQNQNSCYLKTFDNSFASPWITSSNQNLFYFGQRPHVGGRALFWNAWTPQPNKLRLWPKQISADLAQYWDSSKKFLGVAKISDLEPESVALSMEAAKDITRAKLMNLDSIDKYQNLEGDFAIKSSEGSWSRFSPVEPMIKLLNKYPKNLDLVVNCEVLALKNSNSKENDTKSEVEKLITNMGDILCHQATVIMANGVFEPFITIKDAFPNNHLMGKNLLGHFRSQLLVRRSKKKLKKVLTDSNQVGGLYVPGEIDDREFHVHISCYSSQEVDKNYEYLYKRLPDPTFLPHCKDDDYVYYLLQGMAEYRGFIEDPMKDKNYLEMTNCTAENKDMRMGKIFIHLDKEEMNVWDEMNKSILNMAHTIAGTNKEIEYFHDDQDPAKKDWKKESVPYENMKGQAMMHEGGIFWMGDSPESSVTDIYGRVHESKNLYVLGSAIFPTIGSYNPTLTGVALTFRLADHLTKSQ